MTLDDITWNHSCCSEHAEWAEVEVPSGWLRIKRDPEADTYLVTRFDAEQQLVTAEEPIEREALEALL